VYFADTAFWIALFRARDQYHGEALAWQKHLVRTRALIVTTEAVCFEWLNAMPGTATRSLVVKAFGRIRRDSGIEVVPHSRQLNADALELYAARSDKEWSLTDCDSFTVMSQKSIREALTADNHFDQAGFRALLLQIPPD
jgi:predicted nucleic acid-binding protein